MAVSFQTNKAYSLQGSTIKKKTKNIQRLKKDSVGNLSV